MNRSKEISSRLHAIASPDTAAILKRFFKTGPGEYGEGDMFLGIKIPPLRALTRQYRDTDLATITSLLSSKYHEERMIALLLLIQFYQAADDANKQSAYDLYLGNTAHINNWDLVDVTAPQIVGRHLEHRPRKVLLRLARSDSLWERRIAIISTLHFIRQNDFADTLHIAEMLLDDKHDLMHKAVGWMLREIGKRDQQVEERFLQQHYTRLPRTALRYAIERFEPELRKKYMDGTYGQLDSKDVFLYSSGKTKGLS